MQMNLGLRVQESEAGKKERLEVDQRKKHKSRVQGAGSGFLLPFLLWGVSRAVHLFFAAISNIVVGPHDHSTEILVGVRCKFLVRWDAHYFYTIAKSGYISEKSTAFFPLFPWMVRAIGCLGIPLCVSGVLISNICMLLSTVLLFSMTRKYMGDREGLRACILFCFSPCTILYSTLYSESLFCLLGLAAFWAVLNDRLVIGAVFMSFASATRSNGFVLAPLIAAHAFLFGRKWEAGYFVLPGTVFSGIQAYWWLKRFQHIGYSMPYSYVQSRYWDQGFLRFYKDPRNIPNILVGFPFVVLTLWLFFRYAGSQQQANPQGGKCDGADEKGRVWEYGRRFKLLCAYLHFVLLFQTFLSVFFIHMNMHFRFVSFNPVIYWGLSKALADRSPLSRLLLFSYVGFGVAYSVLFGAYFPPA